MAGDWIKMRGNLWDDPRVSALVDATDSSEAAIVGGLYWLWATADQHTEDGCMPGLTLRQIDRKTGIKGFGDALVSIGWLRDDPQGVVLANFTEHNGTSAKRRCTDAQRKANSRGMSASDADNSRTDDGQETPNLGAREEKSREEEIPSLSDSANPTDAADQKPNSAKPESKKPAVPLCPFGDLIDAYEAALPNLPSVTRSLFRDGVNGKATAQRWAWVMTATHEKGKKKGERLAVTQQDGIDWFTRFFAYAAGSDFLTGANGKFTGCSMGWLMTKANFEKVLAGNYHMEKAA